MSKHILLVDDDALLRRNLAFNLQQAGFSTFAAANAEDALAMARQDPPDLVILDIGLPGMDGLDALRHFRESMIDPPAHTVTLGGEPIDLPPHEFELLHALALEAGHSRIITVRGVGYKLESQEM